MITSNEYNKLCALTDELREAQSQLVTAATAKELASASHRFVKAENEWEAFTLGLVVPKSL